MEKAEIVSIFCSELGSSEQYEVSNEHDHYWKVTSSNVEIHFLFERFEDGFGIEVVEPNSKKEPMNLLLLRFLRQAGGSEESKHAVPSFYASLFTKYFADILNGDFSIRKEYESVCNEFYEKLSNHVLQLADDHPVFEKIRAFDISWLKDLEVNGAANV